jgi:NADH-quinone oxidoreductase subunit M
MFFGPLDNPKNQRLRDMNVREIVAVSPFVALVFVIGFFPNLFLSRMAPSTEAVVERYTEGRNSFLKLDPERTESVLMPRRGGPLERGYPQPKTQVDESKAEASALNTAEVAK